MKFSAAFVAAPLGLATAATLGSRSIEALEGLKRYEADRQAVGSSPHLTQHAGIAKFARQAIPGWPPAPPPFDPNAPKLTVPRVIEGEGKLVKTAKRKTIRYGPYKLPSKNEKNWQSNVFKVSGMTDTFEYDAEKPCTTCVILYANAELQYADGKAADTKTGAWLHHLGIVNTGADLNDPICGKPGYEMLFEQGNEKVDLSTLNIDTEHGVKVGTHVKPEHKFILSNELVNMKEEPQYIWVALSYEYLEGALPEYKSAKNLLLSVGMLSCQGNKANYGASNLTAYGVPDPKNRVFTEHSIPWISPFDGTIISTGGHLHDGGVGVKIFHNEDLICNSVAKYAKGAAQDGGEEMEHGSYDPTVEHLAGMNACQVNVPIKKGETIRLEASYDMNAHKPMMNNEGKLDEVMGMAGVLIAA